MIKKLLLSFILFFIFLTNYGQSASGYCFSTGTDLYLALGSGTNVPGLSAGGDDELSSVVPITFPFVFGGTEYSQVVVSSNGWLSFGSPSVTPIQNYTNSVANAGVIGPVLFPLWDDLANTIRPRYVVTGTAPNRIFKLEWSQQKWNFGASGGVLSFQIWLFESSNVIEYHYKQESISVASSGTTFGASIGIYDANGTYLTLNGSGISPNASTAFATNISNKPANNQVYRFTPPSLTSISQAQVGTEYTLCIDNANTVTGTVNSGQYALVNVVNGFNYTFSVQNVFSGIENLTLLDMSDKNVNPAAVASGSSGASLTWTANFSGQVKVLLSGGCIANGTTGGPLTFAINTVSNKQDSQTAVGNDTWKGHIYNWTGTTPPGGSSPATLVENKAPFITTSTTNYAGYYDVGAKIFPTNFNFGGDDDTSCFDVYSDGSVRTSILKHNFAVRYRMKSTQTPGCYIIKIRGDDGVRLYVDTKLVFDRWVQQAPTNYDYILVYLGATSNLVFDYYENASNNQVSYEIKPFDSSANKIYDLATNATTLKFCNGGTPGIIGGSFQYNSEDDTMPNPYIDFRWYVSTNGGSTYALASGTNNLRTYTPPALSANNTTADVVYLYKRTATSNGTVSGGTCNFQESNIVTIINSPRVVITTQPTAQTICEGQSGSFSVASSNINATYQWQYSNSNATGATWTNTDLVAELSGHTTNKLTLSNIPFGYNGNYLRCIVSNGACSATSSAVLLTVYPSPIITGPFVTCVGSPTQLSGDGSARSTNPWVSASPGVASVSNTGNVQGVSAGTALITYTNNLGCSQSVTVTVNPKPVISDLTITVCSGTSFTVVPVNGGSVIVPANTTYSWGLPSGTGFTGGAINSGTPVNITGNLVNATNAIQTAVYTVTPTSSGCAGTPFKVTVTLNPNNTVGAASSSPTLCINVPLTNSTYITHTTTGTTGIGSPSNLPSGLSAAWAANTITISGTPTVSGTFAYNIPLIGGCGTVSATGSITISPATVGGTAASVSCYTTSSSTATITLSGQTGDVIRWESSTDNFVSAPVAITNSTATLSGINVNTTTYYRAVVQSGTCSASTSSVVKLVPGIAPTANNATLPTCNGFTANWTKVNGATSYVLSISDDNFVSTLSGYTNINVGDNSSFSVTGLSSNKTYQYILKSVFSCGTYASQSNVISVTTFELPIAGTFTGGAPSICNGSTTTFSNSTPGGIWSITNGSGTASITTSGIVTGGTQGDVTVVYTVVNGSCSNSISKALIINPLVTKPTFDTPIDVNCAGLGSVTINNLPSGNWKINQTGFVSATIDSPINPTTSYTVTGLAAGSYYFTVSNGTCTSDQSAVVNISDQLTTIWDGNSWSNGKPDGNKKVLVTAAFPKQPFTVDDLFVSACSLTITSSDVVIVPSGVTLTISNAVKTNGKLEFKNNSSLVQSNDDPTINSGDISYERISTPIYQKDYIYWSSPVQNQKLADLSPGTDPTKFYYNDGTNWIQTNRQNTMTMGKGYIIRGPLSYSNSAKQTFPAVFKGVPNNGSLEGELLSKTKYHLIGNPYPSALNVDALIDQNSTLLNGTIYFWTHNTPINSALAQDYQYTTDDYATYNLTGGVSAKSDVNHNLPSGTDNGIKPTGKIAAGQAFFVSTRTEGKVKFNNSMRVGGTNNGQFFKTENTAKENVLEKNRIWLNMTNDKGAFKQLLVGYIQGATNSYENRFDGVTYDGNMYLDFYSVNNGNKFVIQGRALPFDDSDLVPLGYRTTIAGNFTVSIDEVDGKMSNQAIYVEDKVTGAIHDLRTSNYTFKTEAGTFTDRLILRYTGKTLGTDDFENSKDGILVAVKNSVVSIVSSKENLKEVTIFDITGKLLYNKKKVGNTELQIQNLQSGDQVLLVKVTLENEATTTRKIIFQ